MISLNFNDRSNTTYPWEPKTQSQKVKRLLGLRKNLHSFIQESRVDLLPSNIPTLLNCNVSPSMYPPKVHTNTLCINHYIKICINLISLITF